MTPSIYFGSEPVSFNEVNEGSTAHQLTDFATSLQRIRPRYVQGRCFDPRVGKAMNVTWAFHPGGTMYATGYDRRVIRRIAAKKTRRLMRRTRTVMDTVRQPARIAARFNMVYRHVRWLWKA